MGCLKLSYEYEREGLELSAVFFGEGLKKSATEQNFRSNYYPFGLHHSSSWTRVNDLKNNFLFNAGSELNEQTKNYETPFRQYDPALGRFTGIDALASSFSSWTPYQFAYNDPIVFNDPTGLQNEYGLMGDLYGRGAEREMGPSQIGRKSEFGSGWYGSDGGGFTSNDFDRLVNSTYGGSWTESGGLNFFNSHEQAVYAGLHHVVGSGGLQYTALWEGLMEFGSAYAEAYHSIPTKDFIVCEKCKHKVYPQLYNSNHFDRQRQALESFYTPTLTAGMWLEGIARDATNSSVDVLSTIGAALGNNFYAILTGNFQDHGPSADKSLGLKRIQFNKDWSVETYPLSGSNYTPEARSKELMYNTSSVFTDAIMVPVKITGFSGIDQWFIKTFIIKPPIKVGAKKAIGHN